MAICVAIFVVAHLALMIGFTTPDKINFDEVHYVPAAKQLLEPGVHSPLLNPMHPPFAKQIMALSIGAFGDVPLGWRYPSVVFDAAYSIAQVDAFCDALALFKLGYSWGGPVSLVVPYDLATMRMAWPTGIVRGTVVRFSVGFEAVADLRADLAQALQVLVG